MCVKCLAEAAAKVMFEEMTGVRLVEKEVGTARPETVAEIKATRDEAAAIDEQRKEELRAVNAKYRPQLKALEDRRQEGWKKAFADAGIPEGSEGNYSVDMNTGKITLREPEEIQEEPAQ